MATTKATNLGHRSDVTLKGTTTTVESNVVLSDTTTINNAGSDVGLKINSTSSGHIMQLQDGGTDVMVVADGGSTTFSLEDGVTNAVTTVATLRHTSSGTTANGFGTGLRFEGEQPNGGTNIPMASINTVWTNGSAEESDLRFQTGDGGVLSDVMTLTKDGNVDIGGASHSARKLSIKGSANDNSENTIEALNSDSTTIFKLLSDGDLRIPVGNVGIGTTNPTQSDGQITNTFLRVHNSGASTCNLRITGSSASRGANVGINGTMMYIENDENNGNGIEFRTRVSDSTTSKMKLSGAGRLDVIHPATDVVARFYGGDPGTVHYSGGTSNSRGAIMIGSTTNYHGLLSYSDAGTTDFAIWNKYNNSGAKVSIRAGTSGGIYISGNTAGYTSFSDERIKIIDKPITDGLEKLQNVRTVIGSYKKTPETKFPMLIAQDFLEILPEAITTSQTHDELDGEDVYGLNYQAITPLMIKAIQELSAKVTALENA